MNWGYGNMMGEASPFGLLILLVILIDLGVDIVANAILFITELILDSHKKIDIRNQLRKIMIH